MSMPNNELLAEVVRLRLKLEEADGIITDLIRHVATIVPEITKDLEFYVRQLYGESGVNVLYSNFRFKEKQK